MEKTLPHIKKIISDRGKTVSQVAEELGINMSYFSGVINGSRKPSRYMLAFIQNWAGCDVEIGRQKGGDQ